MAIVGGTVLPLILTPSPGLVAVAALIPDLFARTVRAERRPNDLPVPRPSSHDFVKSRPEQKDPSADLMYSADFSDLSVFVVEIILQPL